MRQDIINEQVMLLSQGLSTGHSRERETNWNNTSKGIVVLSSLFYSYVRIKDSYTETLSQLYLVN